MGAIVVEALSKQYGSVQALRDLTLSVEEGCIFGLLGPNGAGKSTLIKALVGALTPTSGRVRVLGYDPLQERNQLRRHIGYMPQEPALYTDLSARQNIAFFARAHDLPDLTTSVPEVLDLTDLSSRADDPVRAFSGGMQRRVSLACALAHRPRVLFLDEPTAAVDPVLRARFWRTFRDMAAKGVTLCISTHLMDEALLCDQVAVLRAGETVMTDTPHAILAHGKVQLTIHRGSAQEHHTIGGHSEDLGVALHAYGLSSAVTAVEVAFAQGLTAWRVSDETVRATLVRLEVRWQRAKHWISSPDPEYTRKKARRDRLIRLAQHHEDLLLGFEDEVWWSRLARPSLFAWQDPAAPLRLVEQTIPTDDLDPKALACSGLLARSWQADGQRTDALWLRFVDGRPVSAVTIDFLVWCAREAAALGKRAVLLIWDNASWHESQLVRTWLREHNRQVKQVGQGARLIVSFLPVKSPWLNPIEPKWLHGKKPVAAPDRLLTATEVTERVCAAHDCPHHLHLVQPPPKQAKNKSKKAA